MRISNNVQNRPAKSFKGVEIGSYSKNFPIEGITSIMVKFTEKDKVKAGKILNLIPNPNGDSFSVFMNLHSNVTGKRTGKTRLKILGIDDYFGAKEPSRSNSYRGYSEDRPEEGKSKFEQLCKLMQKATARVREHLEDSEAIVKEIKEFFTFEK